MRELEFKVDWTFFEKILEANDFTKSTAYDVCKHIYEATYIRYGMKFLEEKMRREKYEQNIVDKVGEIKALQDEIETLKKDKENLEQQMKYQGEKIIELRSQVNTEATPL